MMTLVLVLHFLFVGSAFSCFADTFSGAGAGQCDGEKEIATATVIHFPPGGSGFAAGLECSWKVIHPRQMYTNLEFTSVNLASRTGNQCVDHKLSLYEGGTLVELHCDHLQEPVTHSGRGVLMIVFTSLIAGAVGNGFIIEVSFFNRSDTTALLEDMDGESFSVVSENGSKVEMDEDGRPLIEWDFDGSTDGWQKTTKKSGDGAQIFWKRMCAETLGRMDIVSRDMSKDGKGNMMVAIIQEKPAQGTPVYGSIKWKKLLNTKDYPCMSFGFHMRNSFLSLHVLALDPNSRKEILLWQRDGLDSGYTSGLPKDTWMYWEIPLADFPGFPHEFYIMFRVAAKFRWIRDTNFLAIDRMRFLTRQCVPKFRKTKLLCGTATPPKKIRGGIPSDRGNWPWVVRIHYYRKNKTISCGGALIGPRWVLTAKHCIIDKKLNENYELIFHEYMDGVWDKLHYTMIPEEIFISSDDRYKDVEGIWYSGADMALIKLPYDLTSSDGVINPVCIGSNIFVKPNDQVTFVGWGTDGTDIKTRFLQEVNLTVASCYGTFNFCTRQSNKDVCRGDSGGPGMIHLNGSWHHVGLVESGPKCPINGLGVQVETAKVWSWINHIMTNY